MTSANVTEYWIRNKYKERVGTHSQHHFCKTKWEKLLQFQPLEDHEIHAWGLDEEEEEWHTEDEEYNLVWHNLRDFLLVNRIKID